MKIKHLFLSCIVLTAAAPFASAQQGAPHTLKASANYSTVDLSWCAPADELSISWHDGKDYNGMDGKPLSPDGLSQLFYANKFTVADLKNYVGKEIDSIAYFEYREIDDVNIQIYENGKLVRDQKVNVVNYKKNTWRKVGLKEAYKVPAGVELLIAVRIRHGYNQTFAAIVDRNPSPGKGDIYSYDGINWKSGAPGDFLVTAFFKNPVKQNPDSYNIYADGKKVNQAAVTDLSYTIENQPTGTHQYVVSALYGQSEFKSPEIVAETVVAADMIAPPATISASVEGLKGTVSWQKPLVCANEMTWCGKNFGVKIGGTASSNTKVWIKQEFDSGDMLAYPNHQITAINSFIAEKIISSAKLFVMRNGTIDYYEDITEDQINAIEENKWNKFPLKTPYKLQSGNTYAFGLYYMHTPKGHPVGVDNSEAVDTKGNSFSTSSPNSSDFAKSKPSFKTLASGNIKGNFMLTADVAAAGDSKPAPEISGYDIYRNGTKVKTQTETTFSDEVSELGKVSYKVIAKSKDGRVSPAKEIAITYNLPEEYQAPVILSSTFDKENKKVDFSWSADAVDLKHHSTPSYIAGFEEDMDTVVWGTKFTKEELASCADYAISSIKFGIGAELDNFNLQIYAGKELIFDFPIKKGQVNPGAVYSLTLDKEVRIPSGKDLFLAYKAKLNANQNAIILDAGPAVTNGAMVSLTKGANWLNLSSVAPSFKNYNIVISAVALPKLPAKTAPVMEMKRNYIPTENVITITPADLMNAAGEDFGIESNVPVQTASAKTPAKPKSYKVYRNNVLILETAKTEFSETLDSYGAFDYNISTIFDNGWESPLSKTIGVTNTIPQRTQAPYNLKGTEKDGKVTFTWEAVDAPASVMKYHEGDKYMQLGMTKTSGDLEGYQCIKLPADTLKLLEGNSLSHIKFMLADININTASVFVMKGEDIVYEQEVPVSSLQKSVWNVVRLNKPYIVEQGKDLSIGYHLTYANGVKPLMMDGGPAKAGYGDLISSTATSGYWYSLKTKYKQDYNWRIEGVFKTADIVHELNAIAPADANVTYNMYHNSTPIATGLTEMRHEVKKWEKGSYTVTAKIGNEESAESNAVIFQGDGGIGNISADGKAYYDQPTQTAVFPLAVTAIVYDAKGTMLSNEINTDRVDMSRYPSGAYFIRTDKGFSLKIVK